MRLVIRTNTLLYLFAFLAPVLLMYAWRILDFSSELFTVIYVSTSLLSYFMLSGWRLRIEFLRRTPTGQALALFLVLHISTTLYAALIADGFSPVEMVRQLCVALIPAILAEGFYFRTRERAAFFRSYTPLDTVTFCIFLACMASIMFEFTGIVRIEQYGTRFFGALGDAVAWVLSFCATVALVRGRTVLFGGCFGLLLLTQSRGAILIFAVAFVLQALFGQRRSTLGILSILSLCAVGFFLPYLAVFIEGFFERLASSVYAENDRIVTIKLGLSLFEQHPIVGSGYNTQPRYMNSLGFKDTFIGFGTQVSTAVQVLVDGGLVTIFAYFFFIVSVSKVCLRAMRSYLAGPEETIASGAASWLIAFLWLNHSASWLLPGSLLSPLVFSLTGIIAGHFSLKSTKDLKALKIRHRAQKISN